MCSNHPNFISFLCILKNVYALQLYFRTIYTLHTSKHISQFYYYWICASYSYFSASEHDRFTRSIDIIMMVIYGFVYVFPFYASETAFDMIIIFLSIKWKHMKIHFAYLFVEYFSDDVSRKRVKYGISEQKVMMTCWINLNINKKNGSNKERSVNT